MEKLKVDTMSGRHRKESLWYICHLFNQPNSLWPIQASCCRTLQSCMNTQPLHQMTDAKPVDVHLGCSHEIMKKTFAKFMSQGFFSFMKSCGTVALTSELSLFTAWRYTILDLMAQLTFLLHASVFLMKPVDHAGSERIEFHQLSQENHGI